MVLAVPADPLAPREPDEHFAAEARAADEIGVRVVLVDHALRGVPPDADDVVYRGWMVTSDAYRDARDSRFRTSPEAYARAHELPAWYDAFREHTAESVWTDGAGGVEAALAALGSGAAVVKDYVKSEKHRWEEAAFIPDVADTAAARRVVDRFIELRGDDLVGGVVLRRVERYVGAEVRTWWVDGRGALVTPHPDSPDEPVPPVDTAPFAGAVAGLRNPFVAVDLAQREDGGWRVVEVGDGQVSDRPRTLAARDLVRVLVR